jgi:aminoglycoside/choline kinase family phosphotransferase
VGYLKKPEEISVEWLTDTLGAKSGEIKSVTVEFVGDAIGNTSDVYFVRLNLSDDSLLPSKMVAKMIPQFEGAIDVCKNLKLFEREIENYRHITHALPVRCPELIHGEFDPETSLGFMLMEDCSHCDSFDQTDPVPSSLETLQSFTIAAAKFHAHWWESETMSEMDHVLHKDNPVRHTIIDLIADTWQNILKGGPGFDQIPEEGRGIAQFFADNITDWSRFKWPTENVSLMHHDYRVDNIFLDTDTHEPVIFDWQGASVGPAIYDLAYLLATGYEPDFRREHEMNLVSLYHKTLVDQGISGYSMEEAVNDYKVGLLYNLWVVPFTALLDLSSDRGQMLMEKVIGGIFTGIADHGSDALLRTKLSV